MPNTVLAAGLLGLLGAVIGLGLARASVRLPRGDDEARQAAGRMRLLLFAAGAAVIGVWAAVHGGSWLVMAATALLGWQLLLIATIDAEHFWLPDILTWPLALTGLIANGLILGGLPWLQIVGTVAGFVMLWLLAWLYRLVRKRAGLGGGDPFLFAGAGAWVGWTGLPSVLIWAAGAGLAVILARLALRRAVAGTDRLPFGTFLAVGIWLTWIYGPWGL